MTDANHLDDDSGSPYRTGLWLALVASTVGNAVSSFGGVATSVHLGFGLVTGLCLVGLTARYFRRSR